MFFLEKGEADDKKPQSDNPMRDGLLEIDKLIRNVRNTGISIGKIGKSLIIDPAKKASTAMSGWINYWKTRSDKQVKEDLMFPEKRKNLWRNFKRWLKLEMFLSSIAGWNWVLLVYYQLSKWWANRPEAKAKMRAEILSELQAEFEILDEKIERAKNNKDFEKEAQLKRVKAQLQLKQQQVAGQYMQA